MATFYSSAYEQLPQKPSVYTSKSVATRIADLGWRLWWRYAVPVGQAAADIIKIADIFANVPVAVPQIAGVRLARFVIRSSGNAGGAPTINLGTLSAPTSMGAALTTLQSANTLDVPIATIMACGPYLANDNFQIVIAGGGPTTTLITLDGFFDIYQTTP